MTSSSRIHRNTIWLFAGRTISVGSLFLTYAIVARRLGPSGFGIVAFAMALSAFFIALVAQGFEVYGTRDVAKDLPNAHRTTGQILSARIPIALFSLLLYAAIGYGKTRTSGWEDVAVLSVYALTIFGAVINLTFVYQGTEKMRFLAMREAGAALLSLFGAALFVRSAGDVVVTAVVLVAAQVVNWGWLFLSYVFENGPPRITLRGSILLQIWRQALPFIASTFLISIYAGIDTTILGFFADPATVGLYASALRVRLLVNTTIVIISVAFLPTLARSKGDREQMQDASFAYARTMNLVAVPMILFVWVFADDVLTFAFGSAFAGVATILRIQILVVFFASQNLLYGNPLPVWGKEKIYVTLIGMAAVFNTAGNLVAIYFFKGVGAAVIDLATEALLTACYIVQCRKLGLRMNAAPLGLALGGGLVAVIAARLAVLHLPFMALSFTRLAVGGLLACALYLAVAQGIGLLDLRQVGAVVRNRAKER
ncbi:MAG: flippase [Rhizomicrobium sp.]